MIRRLLLASVLLFAAACGDDAEPVATVPDGEPTIVGAVTSYDGGVALVESDDGDKGSLRITEATIVLPEDEELAAGRTVSVWVSGPIAESFPWQAEADVVRIES